MKFIKTLSLIGLWVIAIGTLINCWVTTETLDVITPYFQKIWWGTIISVVIFIASLTHFHKSNHPNKDIHLLIGTIPIAFVYIIIGDIIVLGLLSVFILMIGLTKINQSFN